MKLLCVYSHSRQYEYDNEEERDAHIEKMLAEGWTLWHTSGNGKRLFRFQAIFDEPGWKC